MRPLAFLGGAVAGAAGLAAAAFIDHKVTESKFSPALKRPETLDAKQVAAELNNYFFKQQAVLSECNRIVIESSDNILTPLPLPWDNALRKAANSLGGGLSKVCRKESVGRLLSCKKQAEELYARYKGVFERANALLVESGHSAIVHPEDFFSEKIPQMDNSAENEDWGDEFDKLADEIRNGIEQSCNIAEQLIEALEPSRENADLVVANS